MELLNRDIKFLAGVGPKKAELLASELNIFSFGDLLFYFPYKHIDKSRFYSISEISSQSGFIQLKGKILSFQFAGNQRKKRLVARFSDGTGSIELIWFKGASYIQQNIRPQTEYVVFGKPALFGSKYTIAHPEMELASKWEASLETGLQAQYNSTEKLKTSFLNSKGIHKLVKNLFSSLETEIPETIPLYLRKKMSLLSLHESVKNIHFPENRDSLRQAEYRLKFEELFFFQLNMLFSKNNNMKKFKGFPFSEVGEVFLDFYNNKLPFPLTGAQKKVLREIRIDLGSENQMNRMLQGDVGSGKTLVALMSMLMAIGNGFQACLMAPTEILATQHLESITSMLEGMDVKVELLTGSTRKAYRRKLHEQLENGEIDILIGTHALIEDTVKFKNLGLVVIDEQHRFGVVQRSRLWKKNTKPPHVLVMTATPIPRTLAMTLYGDLDVSVIDELPPGRKPIQTLHYFDSSRLKLFGFLKKEIAKGRQVYIVYPLIQESEKMDYKDLEDGYESISRAFPIPDYQVSVVHGKMKAEEKEKSMQYFAKGIANIMVATTVIEVGVNVPNASVMVIESAERFGLSQLHQLRGRVGRGAEQSYCILMSGNKLSKEAKTRLETMCRTNDGFEIAEVDLKLRGPGDIEGTQQSGLPIDFKMANLATDQKLIQVARDCVIDLLEDDPDLSKPDNIELKTQLNRYKMKKIDFSVVS